MLELTKAIISCAVCPREFRTGDGIYTDTHGPFAGGWVPPRGWGGSPEPGHRPIMTVSLNPGHPIQGELASLYAEGVRPTGSPEDVTDQAAKAILDYCSHHYDSKARSKDLVYHKKVVAYVRASAWLVRKADPGATFDPALAPWRSLAWITDSFKCSTSRDRGPKIPRELFRNCIALHLKREVQAVQPTLIVALGGAASEALCAGAIPHARARHPSNGCPPLDSRDHDESFAEMATMLRLPPETASSSAFRGFRSAVQRDLFSRL